MRMGVVMVHDDPMIIGQKTNACLPVGSEWLFLYSGFRKMGINEIYRLKLLGNYS